MRLWTRFVRDESAAAAAEFALSIPLLLVLTLGPLELGNYFLSEHALVKGVRDGAVYAAHQDITNYNCSSGSPSVPSAVVTNTRNLVRTGQLSGGSDRLRNWGTATFTMSLSCVTQGTDGTTLSGIYVINGGKVPVITVNASVPYTPLLSNLGFRPATLTLNATQQATAMGI